MDMAAAELGIQLLQLWKELRDDGKPLNVRWDIPGSERIILSCFQRDRDGGIKVETTIHERSGAVVGLRRATGGEMEAYLQVCGAQEELASLDLPSRVLQ